MVIFAVMERDKGLCQICGVLTVTRHAFNRWIDGEGYAERLDRHRKMKNLKAEYDHIIPFSEGGETTLENMRTLCRACHVQRTKEWRKSRVKNDP